MDVGVNMHVDVVGFSFWLWLPHCRLVHVIVDVNGFFLVAAFGRAVQLCVLGAFAVKSARVLTAETQRTRR